MILVADSGSTKTDWALINDDGETAKHIQTQGLNPFHMDGAGIARVLREELLPALAGCSVDSVRFYGTGCTTDKIPAMKSLLADVLGCTNVFVGSDLLGAAHALCGDGEGIACILGTGANSCLYDGHRITANTPPLGYILGDEGSGAVLGRTFLNGIFKGWISPAVRDLYLSETNQTYADVINNVYRQPLANRYLARIAKFLGRHKAEYPELSAMVEESFVAFIHRNIDAYGRKDLPLNFVGSVAWYFRPELKAAAETTGYTLGRVLRSPVDSCDR
ncbi:ATPase [Prevotella lacticifex]|uniref:ATPase n=1 Tax=Prevotella lacticifex TaxID=2854755 RepID=UPI001CC43619|nr:ATPase [Prevotella lacticifex]GJG67065.1 ATPase [Prevotella lacticifex]